MMRSFLVITFCGLLLSGCGVFLTGNSSKLPEAELEARYSAPVERVHKAALQVLSELHITVYSTRKGSQNTIEGMRNDGTEVLLSMEQVESRKTLLKIHVRTKGAQDFARLIDSGIEQKVERRRQSKRKKVITAGYSNCLVIVRNIPA